VCGGADVAVTLEPAATSVGAVLSGAGTTEADCCTTLCSRRVATTGAGAGGAGVDRAAVVWAGADGTGVAGEVETTTVDDFRSVVVQPPDVVAFDEGAVATGVLEEGAAGALVEGAAAAGAVVEAPAVEDTFEPAGAAGDGGGACLAASVVSWAAVMVVSGRTAAVFDALRTLSVGRAGEADRAVARRTCSIIAD
jgi:hypothetical protein